MSFADWKPKTITKEQVPDFDAQEKARIQKVPKQVIEENSRIMKALGGKSQVAILLRIRMDGETRYTNLRDEIGAGSSGLLAYHVRCLVSAGLIERGDGPFAKYHLTSRGKFFSSVMASENVPLLQEGLIEQEGRKVAADKLRRIAERIEKGELP
jgi:DNA-binding HxlR family transcriptional regulator